ncbi:threonylcarbamoyl-AMP synthase [Flavobacterium agricola]|uniref:Threonylcarbamoyl-AMP synthase n=1 Tax=Flavobacterium agricola TaxID=2870839 RepID=A0ABY6M2C6_9FLAO|nr:L-threonylcarbamoyladenylate synthase [Flavobacterium agricola]UYW01875.1 threonylcarbamoyl-AMP synthase [Flavobacterium agricola]
MAQFIKIYEDKPSEAAIDKVVQVLKNGGLIIYPTDTVYGLGCDITNTKALERVAKIKGIKLEKANFSFVCSDISNISMYVKQLDTSSFKILKRALPGPYTFILNSGNDLPKEFKKKKTVGIRVPDNRIAQMIVQKLGNPIVSTSIYDEDEVLEYSTDPELIFEKWQNIVDMVIDGGYGSNVASTIIDLTGYEPEIIREGKGDIDIFKKKSNFEVAFFLVLYFILHHITSLLIS